MAEKGAGQDSAPWNAASHPVKSGESAFSLNMQPEETHDSPVGTYSVPLIESFWIKAFQKKTKKPPKEMWFADASGLMILL